jgi:hypothetical protein
MKEERGPGSLGERFSEITQLLMADARVGPPLQDVLEDVTYMNAMSDDSPKPTKPWEFPDDATLKEFITKELETDPPVFTMDRICENALGFYMVRRKPPSHRLPGDC